MSDYRDYYGPYGSPAAQMANARAGSNAGYKAAVDDICAYVETLNDMYNWNDWVVEKIQEKFGCT